MRAIIAKMKKEYTSACIMEMLVETTGPCGGDAGHGGCTTIEFRDLGGTAMSVETVPNGFAIEFRGDCEMDVLAAALEDAAKFLKLANQQYGPVE